GDSFIKRRAFLDRHAARQTQLQQFVSRKLAATLAHRHYDAVDVLTRDDFAEFFRQSDYARVDQALAKQLRISADEADDAKTGVGSTQNFTRHFHRGVARTDDQDS